MSRRDSVRGPRSTACLPIFVQPGRRPLFQGVDQVGGDDVACPECGNMLARNILPRQLWDIVMECFGCKHRHPALRWKPGTPIGRRVVPTKPSTRVVVPDRTVDVADGLVAASFECHQRRYEERARLAAPVGVRRDRFLDDQESLDDLVRRADLLRGDVLASRASASSPHRLDLLVERARAVAATGRMDLGAVLELSLIPRARGGMA